MLPVSGIAALTSFYVVYFAVRRNITRGVPGAAITAVKTRAVKLDMANNIISSDSEMDDMPQENVDASVQHDAESFEDDDSYEAGVGALRP